MAAVTPGTKLGVYEIIGAIGVGGMGTVYRARDTRLPREVAIKVSAEKFSDRFSREANAIASLNHPNITTLYDVGSDYLVMELVEGPTLADRIKEGPLTIDEAANIGRQIADALDFAHERGIVHRDLKPSNIKIRPDGVVKVLDFGLAKAGTARVAPQSDESPTVSADQTAEGVIVGTFPYMSPEQLAGKSVDKRADVWAFGCVFYEMLTGRRPYQSDTVQELIASILRDDVDLNQVPVQAHRLLRRCLEKDPQKRLRHIGDVMALFDEARVGQSADAATRLWPVAAIVIVAAAAAALVIWAPWRSATSGVRPVRFEVGETERMKFFYGDFMAVSPDGHWMVFPATGEDGVNRYWLRSLETVEARPLPGTESAYVPAAWSSDSRYAIFTLQNSPKLYKVDIQGGPPQALAEAPGALNGATSNKDGVVVFGVFAPNPLFRVSDAGGTVVPVTALAKGETNHRWPQFLPDGRHFLYMRVSADPDRTGVYVGSVDAKPEEQSPTRLLATNRQAYYAAEPSGATGHLVFLRDTTLMAQSFDPVRLAFAGEPAPIADNVDSFAAAAAGLFSVSETGTLVYRSGPESNVVPMWFDQLGKPAGTLLAEPGDYANAAVSPDGTRVAVARGPAGSRDLWVIDVMRGATTRLTFDPADDDNPVWSPDGANLAFSSTRTGQTKLYIKPANGSGEERLLSDQPGIPNNWSTDGRFLLFTSTSPKTGNDIWALSDPGRVSGENKSLPVVATPSNEFDGQLSPDGRWMAYASNEGASGESVYVRPFSTNGKVGVAGARWLVSGNTGRFPRWRSDGKQLFYAMAVPSLGVMAVDIETSKEFQAGTPRRLIDAPPPLIPVGWSLTPDAKRFLFITTPNAGRPLPFTVVLNWAAALKK
ncbi:MAG TPA: protein kinase [Vicinamibacterales bacterium]|jgi:Tol biopolymer transport system component/predicted Ser/Thr protein kinase